MTPAQKAFLDQAAGAADISGHIFPDMAACEAAEESNYGTSQLAEKYFNLFGMKQHLHPVYGTIALPTMEFVEGEFISATSLFVVYPSWSACFKDRMVTLLRLQKEYPSYARALAATDPETYVREVSKTWSTDPERAQKILAIYEQYQSTLPGCPDVDGEISI